jgi:hypothetical protein
MQGEVMTEEVRAEIEEIAIFQTELTMHEQQSTDDTKITYNLSFLASVYTSAQSVSCKFYGRIYDDEGKLATDTTITFETSGNGSKEYHPYNAGVQLPKEIAQFTLKFAKDEEFTSLLPASATLLAATYRNFRAVYSNGVLAFAWEKPSDNIRYGQLGITGDMNITTDTPERAWGHFLPLPREFFGSDRELNVTCTPCARNEKPLALFFGPPAGPVRVISAVPKIISTALSSPQDKSTITINFELPQKWGDDTSKWKANILLAPNGEKPDPSLQVSSTTPAKLSGTNNGYSATFDVSSVAFISLYTVYLFISSSDESFVNLDFPRDTFIPLCAPAVDILRHGGGTAFTLKFSMPQNHPVTKYKLSVLGSGGELPPVHGDKCEIEDACAYFGKDLAVTPVFGGKSGLATKFGLFQKGYYFDSGNKQLIYADSEDSYASKTTSYTLPGGTWFSKKLEGAIESSDKRLVIAGEGGITLTVKTDGTLNRAVYEEWIQTLFEAGLTAGGYYIVRNIVSRTAAIKFEDLECLQLGINLEHSEDDNNKYRRTADVFPGSILRVLTSDFTLQPDKSAGDMQGYSPASAVDFHAALRRKGDAEYIEFDKNLDELIAPWGAVLVSTNYKKVVYGGAVDFYNTNVKRKFVRIFSPTGGFTTSDTMRENINALSNMCLYFSDDLSELEAERKNSNYPPHVNYMVFRGRAALSTCITVRFKNTETVIPAGTTFEKYAERYGITDLANLTLSRRSGFGELVPVFADLNTIGDMPMLAGDELC